MTADWKKSGIVNSRYNQFVELGVDPKPMWLPVKRVIPDTARGAVFADSAFGTGPDSLGGVDSLGLALADSAATEFSPPDESLLTLSDDVSAEDSSSSDTVQVFFRKKIDLKERRLREDFILPLIMTIISF